MAKRLNRQDILAMKIGTTVEFARDNNLSYEDAFHVLDEAGAYEYIERNAILFSLQTYRHLSEIMSMNLNIRIPA